MLQGRPSTLPSAHRRGGRAGDRACCRRTAISRACCPALAVAPNLTLTRLESVARIAGWIDAARERREASGLAARLDVRCRSDRAARRGTERRQPAEGRVRTLAVPGVPRAALRRAHRGIDVAARVAIHRQLREMAASGLAIVVASSDLPEVIALADRVVVLSARRVSRVLARGEATEAAIADAAFAESPEGLVTGSGARDGAGSARREACDGPASTSASSWRWWCSSWRSGR